MKKVLVVVIMTAMHQTWGGTFKPVAETIAVGPLALAGEATLDAASGSVAFADSSAATWAEGAKLTIPAAVNLRFCVRGYGLFPVPGHFFAPESKEFPKKGLHFPDGCAILHMVV